MMFFLWDLTNKNGGLNGIFMDIPSGKHTKSELEHGPVEIVDFPIKHGWIFP
jgi:hypothetical protein